jgi:hypothetical protein
VADTATWAWEKALFFANCPNSGNFLDTLQEFLKLMDLGWLFKSYSLLGAKKGKRQKCFNTLI